MKKLLLTLLTFSFASSLFCFDWPQDTVDSKTIGSYFGQNRGSKISTSLIFNTSEQVKASEDGRIIFLMTELDDENDFFPSTLGTTVIIAHEDQLLSVYGNLDEETMDSGILSGTDISKNAPIAMPGNSGFQTNNSALEFQIIDTRKESAINPKILISRTNTEAEIALTDIYLENKNHDFYQLQNIKSFAAGTYRVYFKRNTISCPYKTLVNVNGVVSDELTFDTIGQENNKIFISGKKKYLSTDVYPNDKMQLLGEATFSPGKTMLGMTISDFLEKNKTLNYNISIY